MTFIKGKPSWNKGKKMVHSGSFRKGHKGYKNSGNFKKGQSSWNKGLKGWNIGHPVSKETIEKIRKVLIASYDKKGRKTDESRIWRMRIEYKLWRESVFTRDNWTCQKCKARRWKITSSSYPKFLSIY